MNKTVKWIIIAVSLVLVIALAAVAYNALSEGYGGGNLSDESTGGETDTGGDNATGGDGQKHYNPAPTFTLTDADGNEVSLEDFRGKPVVLNFWATWCYYCEMEMPDFDVAREKYPDVQFMMINATLTAPDDIDDAKEFIEEGGWEFDVFYDTLGNAARAYSVSSYPATFFIDADGNLVARAPGMLDLELLEQGIAMITEEK